MNVIRAVLAGVGTFYDTLVPPKVLDHVSARSRAYESRGDGPEAVSAGLATTAPASGHPEDVCACSSLGGSCFFCEDHPTSAATPQPAVGDAAGVENTAPADVADGFDWVRWVIPAITDVLAEHFFWFANHSSVGSEDHCLCGARPRDQLDWREHVAPLIAMRIKSAAAAQS